jgi:hypothetical protein
VLEALRATHVLVRDAGTWRLASMHMSFIAGKDLAGLPQKGVERPLPLTCRASEPMAERLGKLARP